MRRGQGPQPDGTELEVAITALGAAGDGLAETAAGRVFVPLALPGERWRVRLERQVAARLAGGPARLPEPRPRARRRPAHISGAAAAAGCSICRPSSTPSTSAARVISRAGASRPAGRRGRRAAGDAAGEPAAAAARAPRGPAGGWCWAFASGARIGSSRSRCARSPARHWRRHCCRLGEALGQALRPPDPVEASLTLTEMGIDLLLHAERPVRPRAA